MKETPPTGGVFFGSSHRRLQRRRVERAVDRPRRALASGAETAHRASSTRVVEPGAPRVAPKKRPPPAALAQRRNARVRATSRY